MFMLSNEFEAWKMEKQNRNKENEIQTEGKWGGGGG